MPENPIADAGSLQFERAITASSPGDASTTPAVVCKACRAAVETEYFDINGKSFCGRCRTAIESAAETPRGVVPFVKASLYGIGAGIIGAVLYYAVVAITHFEIGLVAVVIGYMVGYAVRTGAHGRGGLRFQILAVALTYASVALAYTPLVFGASATKHRAESAPSSSITMNDDGPVARSPRAAVSQPGSKSLLVALAALFAFVAALPVLIVFGSLPSGLISAFIIFIGMRQAWRMTGAPWLHVLGPYAVGAAPASGGA
jgi:hypothetical protein